MAPRAQDAWTCTKRSAPCPAVSTESYHVSCERDKQPLQYCKSRSTAFHRDTLALVGAKQTPSCPMHLYASAPRPTHVRGFSDPHSVLLHTRRQRRAHRIEPVGVQRLLVVGTARYQHGPLAAVLARGVLPLGLNALLEQVEVRLRAKPAGRLYVIVQAAPRVGPLTSGTPLTYCFSELAIYKCVLTDRETWSLGLQLAQGDRSRAYVCAVI